MRKNKPCSRMRLFGPVALSVVTGISILPSRVTDYQGRSPLQAYLAQWWRHRQSCQCLRGSKIGILFSYIFSFPPLGILFSCPTWFMVCVRLGSVFIHLVRRRENCMQCSPWNKAAWSGVHERRSKEVYKLLRQQINIFSLFFSRSDYAKRYI